MKERFLFIINKKSGKTHSSGVWSMIEGWCEQKKITHKVVFTQAPKHATTLAKEADAEGFDRVVAVGGDGTVNEVATGLIGTNIPLAIIPTGSGNGLARHLKISTTPKKAFQQILSGNETSVDTFVINDIPSVNVSGLGFDAHIAHLFGQSGKRGLAEYTRLIIQEFSNYDAKKIHIEINQSSFDKEIFMLSIANSSQFGNNAYISPRASLCDGKLDICLVKKIPWWRLVGFVLKLFTRRLHRSRYVEIIPGEQFRITSPTAIPLHVDGEASIIAKDFDVRIIPKSLKIIIPSICTHP